MHGVNAFDEDGEPTYTASLVVAPTYGNAMDFCVPALQDRFKDLNLSWRFQGSGYLPGGRFSAPALILTDFGRRDKPSAILIRSADVPNRITGFTVAAAWGDEPTRWKSDPLNPLNDALIQIFGRVRRPEGVEKAFLQIMFTYTNEGDTTRIYEEMHTDKTDRALYTASTYENPVGSDFADRQKGMLTEELVEQYIFGGAASFTGGKVYPKFDMSVHVNSNVKLRRDFPLHISLDFNRVPGMHLEVGQHHYDLDLLTVVNEIYAPKLDVETMASRLALWLKQVEWDFETSGPLQIYGDASGRAEWEGTGQSDYTLLQLCFKELEIPYEMHVPLANPSVVDSINAFNCALRDFGGKHHWECHPCCARLIEDMRKLMKDKFGKIDKTDKMLSHGSDAERYRVWNLRPIRLSTDVIGGRIITG